MRISTRQPQKILQLDGWQETLKYDILARDLTVLAQNSFEKVISVLFLFF